MYTFEITSHISFMIRPMENRDLSLFPVENNPFPFQLQLPFQLFAVVFILVKSEAKCVILPGGEPVALHHLLSFDPYSIGEDIKLRP